ncbi:MAG: T9SS type A sorting domain-containing protein [Reichenbachiella sp.]
MKIFLTSIFILSVNISIAQNILVMEYYLDTDPGYGAGISIPITPGANVDVDFVIPNASLSEGFHTLVIRAQDANLDWSVQEVKNFYVSPSDPVNTASITNGEYYIDTDPGYGNGNPISVTPGITTDTDFIIPTSSLLEGFHNVVIRMQDSDGQWGVQENMVVFVSGSDPVNTASITNAEYYIDTDPGYGNGTPIAVSTGVSINTDFIIPSSSLPLGFHNIVIRTQDSDGQWGMQESIVLFVSSSDHNVTSDIINAEYYLDIDPGVGNGTALTIDNPSTSLNLDFVIPNASLPEGFHTLVLRTQDSDMVWGIDESIAFYVSNSNPLGTTMITDLEYFIDVDPGPGNGTQIDIVDAVNFDEEIDVLASSLAGGVHTINFRALDEMGVWSLVESRSFLVDKYRSNAANSGISSKIAQYEYFIDEDPGYGMATSVMIDPAAELIDENFSEVTNGLSNGTHSLGVRVSDENGFYSQTDVAEFTICTGANVQFTAITTCIGDATVFTDESTGVLIGDVYSWDFDNDGQEDEATVGDVSHTFESTGVYTVSLTISNADCTASNILEVSVVDLPNIVANASSTDICLGDEITLTGSGGTSYTWNNGVSNEVAFSPTETTTYTVTGTDGDNCENTDIIAVTVSEVPIPSINIASDNGRQVVLSSSSETGNQWYESGNLLEGETDQLLSVERTYFFGGNYSVTVTEGNCFASSDVNDLEILSIDENLIDAVIQVWPNPASNRLKLRREVINSESVDIRIIDIAGSLVKNEFWAQGEETLNIDLSEVENGMYILLVEGLRKKIKFIKE